MSKLAAALLLSLIAWSSARADTPPTFVTRFGGWDTEDGHFSGVGGIAIDGTGQVYVTDFNNGRVQQFDASGQFLAKWPMFTSNGALAWGAYGAAFGDAGNLYVAEVNNSQVQEFTRGGVLIRQWGTYGNAPGQFGAPSGVGIAPNGNVYVCEQTGQRIQEFDPDGGFIRVWGSFGSGDGQFSQPRDVAVARDGSVYVADRLNDRVQKFDSTGTFLAKWDWASIGTPSGIAVDAQGNLWVTDRSHGRVVKLDPSGYVLTTFGTYGTAPGQFLTPDRVAVSPSGFVYVTDSQTSMISVFAPAAAAKQLTVDGSIPDPVSGPAVIRFELPTASRVTIGLYDVSGRLVRRIARDQLFGAGIHHFPWDGMDDAGRRMAAGVYRILVQSGAGSASKPLVVVN